MSISKLVAILFFLCAGVSQAAMVPTIKAVSVTPTSAAAGTMFKFTATLNAPLTKGNKVKIDLGKGLASMTGTKTNYSLSRAIYTVGSQTYKVGIYNSKNVLQGSLVNGSYNVGNESSNTPPTLSDVIADASAIAGDAYKIKFTGRDSDDNLAYAIVNWGDGSTQERYLTEYRSGSDWTIEHNFGGIGQFNIEITVYDNGTPNLSSKTFVKAIDVYASRYKKVCNSGSFQGEEDCSVNPAVGKDNSDWRCTYDEDTDLMWEIELPYDTDRVNWFDNMKSAQVFVQDTNNKTLCGRKDWRIPTFKELASLVQCSSGKYNTNYGVPICYYPSQNASPTIVAKKTFFPNTDDHIYIASDLIAIDFGKGTKTEYQPIFNNWYYLRLVSGGDAKPNYHKVCNTGRRTKHIKNSR